MTPKLCMRNSLYYCIWNRLSYWVIGEGIFETCTACFLTVSFHNQQNWLESFGIWKRTALLHNYLFIYLLSNACIIIKVNRNKAQQHTSELTKSISMLSVSVNAQNGRFTPKNYHKTSEISETDVTESQKVIISSQFFLVGRMHIVRNVVIKQVSDVRLGICAGLGC